MTLLFVLAGLVVNVYYAIKFFREQRAQSTGWVLTEGVIESVTAHDGNFFPVVAYAPADGTLRRFTSDHGATWYRAGRKISVRYDPADPDQATTADFASTHMRWMIGALGGCIFFVWSIVLIVCMCQRHG